MVFEEGPTKVMITPKVFYSTQKKKFFIKDFSSKCCQIRSSLRDLVTLTREIFNGKVHFWCSESNVYYSAFFEKKRLKAVFLQKSSIIDI